MNDDNLGASTDARDLTALMERSISGLTAPDRLEPAVLLRGRSMRRRRRLGVASGAVVAIAASTVLAVAVSGGNSPAVNVPVATATSTPAPPVADGQWWIQPSKQLLATLTATVPEGVEITDYQLTLDDVAPGEDPNVAGVLRAKLKSPNGVGGFEAMFYSPEATGLSEPPSASTEPPSPGTEAEAEAESGTPPDAFKDVNVDGVRVDYRLTCTKRFLTCRTTQDPDGVPTGRYSTTRTRDGVVIHEAYVLDRKANALAYFATSNSTDDKWGVGSTIATPAPPLTLTQLEDLATTARWMRP